MPPPSGGGVLAMPSVVEPARPPLHDNSRLTPNVHAPPGVLTETFARSGSNKRVTRGNGEAPSFTEAASFGVEKAGEEGGAASADLRVSTPTGDGGASDLSLWVTIRGLEDAKELGGFSSCSPASSLTPLTVLGADSENGGRSIAGGVSGAEVDVADDDASSVGGRGREDGAGVSESLPLLAGGKGGGVRMSGESSGGKSGSVESLDYVSGPGGRGEEPAWKAFVRALWGLLDFCRPRGGDVQDDY